MILGDSLQVMASLAEREGLRGKVQCIYLDPPYGIKFNSNFQWSTTSRDVKDGKAEHITRESPSRSRHSATRGGRNSLLPNVSARSANRSTRPAVQRAAVSFVQIGDENVHRFASRSWMRCLAKRTSFPRLAFSQDRWPYSPTYIGYHIASITSFGMRRKTGCHQVSPRSLQSEEPWETAHASDTTRGFVTFEADLRYRNAHLRKRCVELGCRNIGYVCLLDTHDNMLRQTGQSIRI